ncbi:acyltransferase family protein [Verrucomicrobiota bacterium]
MTAKLDKLDMLRGAAAVYVFLYHSLPKDIAIHHCFRFAQEAVIAFFLLSGFVIHYSSIRAQAQPRPFHCRRFLVRRFVRIYPIFIVSLLVAYVIRTYNPDWPPDTRVSQLLGNLCMLQDVALLRPNTWVNPYCGNLPLWSLSYEWWFYVLYMVMMRFSHASSRFKISAVLSLTGCVTYVVFPFQGNRFLMYFALWWAGAEIAELYTAGESCSSARFRRTAVLLTTMLAVLIVNCLWRVRFGHTPFFLGRYPFLEVRHFAAALLLLLLGAVWARHCFRGFRRLFSAFAAIAPFSYALYVFHYPIVTYPDFTWLPNPFLNQAFLMLAAVLLAVAVEVPYQRYLAPRLTRWLTRGLTGLF